MIRTITLVVLAAAAAAGVIGGCGGSQAGCSLSGSDITCTYALHDSTCP